MLGDIESRPSDPKRYPVQQLRGATVQKIQLNLESGIAVPLLLLCPPNSDGPAPVVIGLCQQGKAAFLKNNASAIAALLDARIAVCLPDVRGTGETRTGDGRGRRSSATSISSSELMLGQTLLGSQLRDLRSVLRFLREENGIDASRVALWGTSFAKPNPHDRDLGMPLELEPLPDQSEPLGGLLALFGASYERVRVVYAQNGLAGFKSVLESPFVYLPHDAVIPAWRYAGDLCDLASWLAPRPLRIEGPVDGLNRGLSADALKKTYALTSRAYEKRGAEKNLLLLAEPKDDGARWLIDALKSK
jgi:hypothetical protein